MQPTGFTNCFVGIDPGKGGAVGIIKPGLSVEEVLVIY